MFYKRLPQPTVSAVGTVNYTITKESKAQQVMAEVVLGAGTGTVSVQFSGSNDNTNFTNIGSAVTATTRNVNLSPANGIYLYYRAIITISTNTKVTDVIFYTN